MNAYKLLGFGEKDENTVFAASIVLLCFAVPFIKWGIQFFILFVILSWAFSKKLPLSVNWKPILIFSGIYIFHAIMLLWSTDLERGGDDMVQKLSLIIFPFILGTSRYLGQRVVHAGLIAFVLGTIGSVLFAYATSLVEYHFFQGAHVFYAHRFHPWFHPSYLAMFANFSMFILVMKSLRDEQSWSTQFFIWLGILGLSVSLIFPASKMGFVGFALVVLGGLFAAWIKKKRLVWQHGTLLVAAVAFFLALKSDQTATQRISNAVATVSGDEDAPKASVESNNYRLIAWEIAVEEIVANPFGVGTGSESNHFGNAFREAGYPELAAKDLNPHNTYFQIALAQGLIACLWFLFSLAYPLKQIWNKKIWIYGFFIAVISVNFAVESMLEKQSGVIFFAFFNALLFFHVLKPKAK
ncbi:MAG TPA: O-antigen ligase family protein [Cryomorphaceae bacterium]|nr:O-antigen ligase family protein [Cryomorphaceae bacterium]